MTRIYRIFVLVLGMGAALWSARADERPNFVIMVADDMAWNDSGAYGHPHIRTPNIDRLAREGMRFEKAILTISSCSPSRCSILTGRYPHATGAPELHLPLPEEQILVTEPLRQAGYFTASAGKWHLGEAARSKFDRVVVGGGPSGCENWIPTLRDRPRDRPFFLWLAAMDPHRGYADNTLANPQRPEDVRVPPFLPDTPKVRRDLALYYDEITRLDGFVGKVLDELEAQGVADNTFVLFLSDNGRPFPRCKTTIYDEGIRTPFIVRWPGHVKPGSSTASLVSAVDIAPTILKLAGLEIGPSFQGLSFAPILDDPTTQVREFAFAEHNWHDYMAYERAVRSPRFTYIRNWRPDLPATPPADAVNSPTFAEMKRLRDEGAADPVHLLCFQTPRPPEELYDLRSDPHSLNNLAEDPQYTGVLQRMRTALEVWRQETRDHMPATLTPDGFDRETGRRLPGVPTPHPSMR